MTASFGPWSTAITTGANHQLSTFWKRRLAMLASIYKSPSCAARRTWALLAIAATLALMWPTIHAAPAAPKAKDAVENGVVAVEYLPRPSSEEAKILRALEMPVDVDFSETPLQECLKILGQSAGIRVAADERRLAEQGFELDAPVTLKLSGRHLEVVLDRMFKLMGQERREGTLDFLVDENELRVTTSECVYELVDRWYPVWDLESTNSFHPATPRNERHFATPSPHVSELILMMTTSVQPDSWEAVSGPGSVAYVGELGCLAVRQTQSAHREIVKLLRMWREARNLKRAAAAGDVRRVTE